MERIETDILVVGGGIAGLTATCAFASAGLSALCVDPAAAVTDGAAPGADLRSTAFLQPARATLEAAGLWARLAPHAAPLRIMRLVDAGGPSPVERTRADFDAAELGEEPFGWNFPNWLLRREMQAHLEALPGASLARTGFARITPRLDHALVRLTDGRMVRARLVIAADGRDSAVREALGIPVRRHSYGQKALVFAVSHTEPHDDVSIEVHRTGGPFTLVPLPGAEGRHRSAVVWMEEGPEAVRLQALPREALEAEIDRRSCGVLGRLTLESGTALWPIISQLARRMNGPRTALVAEAAHVVPPIGAQGLNLSLKDIQCLVDLATAARAAGEDIGAPALLARYHAARWPDCAARLAGIDALNRAARFTAPGLRDLRRSGLALLHGTPPLRRLAMRAGLGMR
ncbi:UbiH/UbiF family hydroxylase [Oceanicella sp. SM1341]|uniref:UbiH/UbiF family hydroxylase n=1 Tax=Oceanicella sp. SM1341 TaxID=1548889 RepID=UPI000E48C92D|nr:UbiH/UbiF family hydroxylase [Oceanicella sp. SM1341]